MRSESRPALPLIDLSMVSLNPGTPDYNLMKSQVVKAIEDYGCFSAVVKVPEELQKSIFPSLEQLFDLPEEVKKKNVFDKPQFGYTHTPPVQTMGFIEPSLSAQVESVTNVLWPEGNPYVSKTIQSFSDIVVELQKLIRRMILESLGLHKYLDEHMNSTEHALKVIKYEAPFSPEEKIALRTHSDVTVITILYDNQVDGLEVQSKDGQWFPVKTRPDSFTVMLGESFVAWSNGRVYATPHRVMMRGDKERYSLALYSTYKEGYIVKTPEELVDEDHPLLYKPFDFLGYLKFFQEQLASNNLATIKDYCGV